MDSLAGGQLERYLRLSSLETELHTDLGIGKHLYSLTHLLLGGGNPVASWEGKIANLMGFVLHDPGAQSHRRQGCGVTERNFRVLVSCLDAPGGVIYSLGTSAD